MRGEYKILFSKDIDTKVATYLERISKLFIKCKGSFNVALAGGNTPLNAYKLLSQRVKDFNSWNIFLTDERFVSDERSNCLRLKEFFKNIKCFDTSLPPEESAKLYSKELKDLDFILLGIGKDGHTASLFPNRECKKITPELCITTSPDGLLRISLTEEFINSAQKIAFFVKGEEKREVLEKLLLGEDIPASRIRGKRKITVLTDLQMKLI